MYSLIRCLSLRRLLYGQIPSLVGSFFIAEVFYKFHSFTLECAAFLGTWFVLDWALTTLAKTLHPVQQDLGVEKPVQ